MKQLKRNKKKNTMYITFSIIASLMIGSSVFLSLPTFGRNPRGERLEKVKTSSNYSDGRFQNQVYTPQMSEDTNFFKSMFKFIFKERKYLKPKNDIPTIKTDLRNLDPEQDLLVWFGHGSYFIQLNGKRILVDPVFSKYASPVSFINRSFKGTNLYTTEEIPDIDFLIITHDHWDHLDSPTVKKLRPRTGKVICPLGVGANLERWGFEKPDIFEMDWNDENMLAEDLEIYCLPGRHFSGRSLVPNKTLWASFLLKTPGFKMFLSGDGGYDTHFQTIGERFGEIDFAILENGQYDQRWKYIHMLPDETVQAGKDLRAKNVIPVHNSKFALANHSWDEPLKKVTELHNPDDYDLLTPMIGQIVNLHDSTQTFDRWWENTTEK